MRFILFCQIFGNFITFADSWEILLWQKILDIPKKT